MNTTAQLVDCIAILSPHDNGETYFLTVQVPSTNIRYFVVAGAGLNAYDQSQIFQNVKVMLLEAHSNKHGIATEFVQMGQILSEHQVHIKNALERHGYFETLSALEKQAAEFQI